jgi:hypothetical protein
MSKLTQAYEKYIEFLGECMSNHAGYLYIHGIQESDENIKKGEELRKEIAELKKNDVCCGGGCGNVNCTHCR